ncbi:MAG: Holo-[acyl-carrier-protein] synthase [Chlamydiae bacterium]|nr:Holo-[acyl-carrier-protein] synthase [Chlamydiota bacterium]
MILGLGNDIIEISRVKSAYEEHKQNFLNRLFTEKEQEYCKAQKDPFPRFAGRFAAKEAIVKALGCGFGSEVAWKDIEIIGDENGKPEVHLSSELKRRFDEPTILVTISHCKEYASAVAILLKNAKGQV